MLRMDLLQRPIERHLERDLRRRRGAGLERVLLGGGLALPFPRHVVADIDEDAAQPRPQSRIALESVDPAVPLDERPLPRALRALPVPDDVEGDRFQPRSMRAVQALEGVDVLPPAPGQQFGLGPVVHALHGKAYRQARPHHSLRFTRRLDARRSGGVGNIRRGYFWRKKFPTNIASIPDE